jgi:hypothetical protein
LTPQSGEERKKFVSEKSFSVITVQIIDIIAEFD